MTARAVIKIPGLDVEVPEGLFSDLDTAKDVIETRLIEEGVVRFTDLDWRFADGRWELFDGSRFTGFRIYEEQS